MQYAKTLSGAAVLLALAPSVMAVGYATVVNNCGFPIYFASVAQNGPSVLAELTDSYSEAFTLPDVGVSIKLAMENTLSGPVSQFEFTWANGMIAYDISNINGYPFSEYGMEVYPSMVNDAAFPTCVNIACPPGEAVCDAAYNQPDDTRTMVCDQDSNITLVMCPAGSPSKPGSQTRSLPPAKIQHVHQRLHSRHMLR